MPDRGPQQHARRTNAAGLSARCSTHREPECPSRTITPGTRAPSAARSSLDILARTPLTPAHQPEVKLAGRVTDVHHFGGIHQVFHVVVFFSLVPACHSRDVQHEAILVGFFAPLPAGLCCRALSTPPPPESHSVQSCRAANSSIVRHVTPFVSQVTSQLSVYKLL